MYFDEEHPNLHQLSIGTSGTQVGLSGKNDGPSYWGKDAIMYRGKSPLFGL
jgi:hypothetical protein